MKEERFTPGLYRHYSGGLYIAIMLVHHHETREEMVVYASCSPLHGEANGPIPCSVRPFMSTVPGADSWTDIVTPEGALIVTWHDRKRMLRGEPGLDPAPLSVAGGVQRFTYLGAAS